jgi:hypothetical protein
MNLLKFIKNKKTDLNFDEVSYEKIYPYRISFFNFEIKRLSRIFSNNNILSKSMIDKKIFKNILQNRKKINREKIKEFIDTLDKIY